MDLHLHTHRWVARSPDWTVAAIAGFGAGGVLMLLELLWMVTTQADNPWQTSRMVAAIAMGRDVLGVEGYSSGVLAVALAVHYALGIAFGIVLGALIASFHFDSSVGMALAAGAVFGLLLYVCNFYVIASAFPWLRALQGWSAAFGHLVFGMIAAYTYLKLERPRR
jgi:hypothetical protein